MEKWHHGASDEGSIFDGSNHPAGQVGFEGVIVGIASAGGLAGDFVHYSVLEEDVGGVENTIDACLPESGSIRL